MAERATPVVANASLSRREFIDRTTVTAGGVAVAVAVAGCAGGSNTATGSAAPSADANAPIYQLALADAPELAKTGGVLRVEHEIHFVNGVEQEYSEAQAVPETDGDAQVTSDADDVGTTLNFDFYVIREADDAVVVFNNVCSHKNCATKYDPVKNDFACPCHKSRFDLSGQPHGGPAKGPLKRFPATLVDGVVTVTLKI